MALLGSAALAMWWDMMPEARAEFLHWHSHEHFPERLGIPGFLRGTRWQSADGGPGFFVMYELAAYETLSSPAYAARLNAPTPWSTKMMPHHRNMIRSQCRVLESCGGGVAQHALTVRFAPAAGREDALRASLHALIHDLAARPGIVGAHLLQHATPPIAPTTEQRIRGNADRAADRVFVACGYDLAALERLAQRAFDDAASAALRADAHPVTALYTLSHSAVSGDVAPG